MTGVRRSLFLSAIGNYVGLLLQIASTVVIARLLSPSELGVFAVSAAFAALASTLRDFGIAEFLIQEKNLDRDTLRAAYGVNIVMSWSVAAVVFFLAPMAGDFYATPGVTEVMQVQAASFVLIPFGAVTMAWYRRALQFGPIVVSDVAAQAASLIVAITLALQGFSYMSLAWSSLVGTVVAVACSFYFRPPQVPLRPSLTGARRVLEFGRYASGIYIVGQAGRSAPGIVVGRALNMEAVGILSRAEGFVEVFNRLVLKAVMPICLPYFSADLRDTGHLRKSLLVITSYMTVIGWTAFGLLAATAFSLVAILYGEQWRHSVPLAQVLCAAAAFELLYFPAKEALLALGRPRAGHWLQLFLQGLRVVGLLAVIPFGLFGACVGLLAAAMVGAGSAMFVLVRAHQISWQALGRELSRSAIAAAIALTPGALILWLYPLTDDSFVANTLACWVAVIVAWPIALLVTRHPLLVELRTLLAPLRARWLRRTG